MKTCTKCHKELPATSEYFHRRLDTRDGLHFWCKACRNIAKHECLRNASEDVRRQFFRQSNEYAKKLNDKTRQFARHHREPWTTAESNLLLDPTVPFRAAAVRLGRTYMACEGHYLRLCRRLGITSSRANKRKYYAEATAPTPDTP